MVMQLDIGQTIHIPDVSGDAVFETTRLNTKGGSLTAILKKRLSAAFPEGVDEAAGALLDFGDHGAAVLLIPALLSEAGQTPELKISRLSDRRFVVDLVDEEASRLDPMTQAFLTMIVEQFKRGERALVSADEAFATFDALLDQPLPDEAA